MAQEIPHCDARDLTPRSIARWSRDIQTADDGCWIWLGEIGRNGYGRFSQQGPVRGRWLAHRLAYELVHGPIPAGLEIDHLCRVRACVRPDHLEAVSPAVNKQRAAAQRPHVTHCPKGHEYTPENTRWTNPRPPRLTAQRQCRTCHREAEAGRQRGLRVAA